MHTNECEMCGLIGVDLALYTCKQCRFLGCAQCINQITECCTGCSSSGKNDVNPYSNEFTECPMCYSKIAIELFYCEYCQKSGCTFCIDAKSNLCCNCWRLNLEDPTENLSPTKNKKTQKNKTRGTIESKYSQKHIRKTLENLDRTKKKKK
jgi:hypothetical protein